MPRPRACSPQPIKSMTTLNRARRRGDERRRRAPPRPTSRASAFWAISATCCARGVDVAGTPIGAKLSYSAVPVFDRVTGFLKEGLCPGGTKRNLEYAAPNARFADELAEPQRLLLADARDVGRPA